MTAAAAVKTRKDETDVERFSRELQEKAAADGDARETRNSETREAREAREADEQKDAAKLQQLGRVEEIRASLGRNYENYAQSVDQAVTRLRAMVGPATDPDVKKAAEAVADAFDITVTNKGLTQPKLAKGAKNPFERDTDE